MPGWLGKCGPGSEELPVIQGPRENQLTYKVGQGRGLPERAGFPGRGGGSRGWWVASEDGGRRVCVGW